MTQIETSVDLDGNARDAIIRNIHENFFVEAGAGSGKTTILVSRMVAMVEAGIDISKMCAITFTKAAAREFYERFQAQLAERSDPNYVWEDKGWPGQLPEPDAQTRDRCANALQHIDLCFMGTIDSFCYQVLSEHPVEAGVPANAVLVVDDEKEMLLRQEYAKICEGAYGVELKALADEFRSLYWSPADVFMAGMKVLMDKRNVHFNFEPLSGVDFETEFAADKKRLLRALDCLIAHPELKYSNNEESTAAWDEIEKIRDDLSGDWSNVTNVSNSLKDNKKKGQLKGLRVLPVAVEQFAAEIAPVFVPGGANGMWLEGKDELTDLRGRLLETQYRITMTFLTKCVDVVADAMRSRGHLTFFDCLFYLRNMLQKDAAGDGKLIDYIHERHSYFLIDEFQDTNPMQAEVFFYLTAQAKNPAWNECKPRKGSLFIVGDPKQSIYRFRSADVASFMRVRELFRANGDSVVSLTRNFRSVKPLCAHFNRVFPKLLPEDTPEQSKYEEIPLPDKDVDGLWGVYTYEAYGALSTAASAKEHPEERDPFKIADIISSLVDSPEHQITDKNGVLRPIRYSDFLVITSGKDALLPIMTHLDERGIPTRVDGKVTFADNEALKEVCNIYFTLADPENEVALYAALTCRLLGCTNEDLMRFVALGGRISLNEKGAFKHFDCDTVEDESAQRVADALVRLQDLRAKARQHSPASLFMMILDEFSLFETVAVDGMEIPYYALELLRAAEKSGEMTSLKDGAMYLQSLLDDTSGKERCLSLSSDENRVHMANLHKVKGLEAPIVILAQAGEGGNKGPSIRIQHGDGEPEGYVFSVSKEDVNWSYFETVGFSDEKDDEREARKAEGVRTVYVAGTRARNVLIINTRASNGCKWKGLLEDNLPDIFNRVTVPEQSEDDTDALRASELYANAESECVLNNRSAEDATYSIENPSGLRTAARTSREIKGIGDESQSVDNLTRGSAADVGSEPEEKVTSEAHKYPTLLGHTVHKLMEILVLTKNTVPVQEAVEDAIREYREPRTVEHEPVLRKVLLEVAETMRSGGYAQKNGAQQDMLSTLLAAEETYCEVPFCYKDARGEHPVIWNGIMDVIYKDAAGWHIVDYKTNSDGDDLDTKYQAQLEAYRLAFKELTDEDADTFTYHIAIA